MPLSESRTYIVTGASSGIGQAVSLALARRGMNLVLNARHAGPLIETAEACRGVGAEIETTAGDVDSEAVCREMTAKAQALGDFYGIIHAAGVLHPGPYLWEFNRDQVAGIINAGLTGTLSLIRIAVPRLSEQGRGVVVLFGSGAVDAHLPGIGLYSAVKAAEEFIGLQLAVEAPELSTIVFRPAIVDTRMQAQAREAQGGAAQNLRPHFQTYRNQGLLLTPDQAAQALLKVLKAPETCRGRIVDAYQFL